LGATIVVWAERDWTLAEGASGGGTSGVFTADALIAVVDFGPADFTGADFADVDRPACDAPWPTCPGCCRPAVGRHFSTGPAEAFPVEFVAEAAAVWARTVAAFTRPIMTISETWTVALMRRIIRNRMACIQSTFQATRTAIQAGRLSG
jgi:hypothetical protein